jgi:hypothetical protein
MSADRQICFSSARSTRALLSALSFSQGVLPPLGGISICRQNYLIACADENSCGHTVFMNLLFIIYLVQNNSNIKNYPEGNPDALPIQGYLGFSSRHED